MQADSPTAASQPVVRVVPVLRPFAWLADGWRDLAYAPGVSLVHGFIVAIGGWVIASLALSGCRCCRAPSPASSSWRPSSPPASTSSRRRRERGEPGDMACALDAWRRGTRPLVWLGLGLAFAGTAWVLVSALLVAVFVKAPITGAEAFLRHVVFSEGSNLFLVWVMAGGFGASLVFAATVVSAPLLLDRDTDLGHRRVGQHPRRGREPGRHGRVGHDHHGGDGRLDGHGDARLHRDHPRHRPRHLARLPRHASTRGSLPAPGMSTVGFGYTEAQIAEFGVTFGVGGFILFMLFIIGSLARESKAGKFGTFILFFVLAFGMLGFVAKAIIQRS